MKKQNLSGSVLAGLLVKEGKFGWNDPVVDHLSNFKLNTEEQTRSVTIGHILSHSTGLIHHAYTNLIEADVPYSKIFKAFDGIPIVSRPGESYGYQNVIYSLIGDVMESVTDSTFEELVHERLFSPLGMQTATIGFEPYLENKNRAAPHIRRNGEWTAVEDKESFYMVPPAAGINASIEDMVYWLLAMMGLKEDVISSSLIEEVITPRINTPRETERIFWPNLADTHYGYGWRIYDYSGMDLIYHGGGVQGYLAQIAFVPEKEIGIVILFNSRRTDRIVPIFLDLFLDINGSN